MSDATAVQIESVPEAAIGPLIQDAQRGRAGAFAEIVSRYSARLYHFLLGMGVDSHDAEDVLQETFIKAYENLHRYDKQFSFSTWLFTIGRRQAISLLRGQRKSAPLSEGEAAPARGAGTEAVDVSDEADSLWRRAAALLTPQQYEALWLRYGEDLSMKEVSERMAITEANTRVLLHRARAKLSEEAAESAASKSDERTTTRPAVRRVTPTTPRMKEA